MDTSQSDLDDVHWNKMNDSHSYSIFFVDFGNTETSMRSSDMRSLPYVTGSKAAKTAITRDELDFVLTLPFQTVCCELKLKKPSARNADTLKTLMNDHLNFQAKMVGKKKKEVLKDVSIDKYTCHLSLEDGQNLDNQFEDEEVSSSPPQPPQPQPTEQKAPYSVQASELPPARKSLDSKQQQEVDQTNKNAKVAAPPAPSAPAAKVLSISIRGEAGLKVGKSYECKCIYFSADQDIYVNLKTNSDELQDLEAQLADFEQPKVAKKAYEL